MKYKEGDQLFLKVEVVDTDEAFIDHRVELLDTFNRQKVWLNGDVLKDISLHKSFQEFTECYNLLGNLFSLEEIDIFQIGVELGKIMDKFESAYTELKQVKDSL